MATNTDGELGLLGKLQSSLEPFTQYAAILLRDKYLDVVERYKAQKEDFAKSGVMLEENCGSELVTISFQDALWGYNPYARYLGGGKSNIPDSAFRLYHIFGELHDLALVAWPIIVQAGSKQALPTDTSIDDVFK